MANDMQINKECSNAHAHKSSCNCDDSVSREQREKYHVSLYFPQGLWVNVADYKKMERENVNKGRSYTNQQDCVVPQGEISPKMDVTISIITTSQTYGHLAIHA